MFMTFSLLAHSEHQSIYRVECWCCRNRQHAICYPLYLLCRTSNYLNTTTFMSKTSQTVYFFNMFFLTAFLQFFFGLVFIQIIKKKLQIPKHICNFFLLFLIVSAWILFSSDILITDTIQLSVCVCVSFSVSCMFVCDWICLCNIVEWRIYIFIKKLLVHVFCFKNMYFRGDSNGPPTTSQRNRCVWSVFTDVQNTQHSLSSLNSYTFRYIPSFLKQCLLQKNIHTLRIRWRKTIPKRKQ